MLSAKSTIARATLLSAAVVFSTIPTTMALNFQLGSGNRVNWANNCDFYGDDLYSTKQPNTKCGDICADDPRCTHWTWEPTNGCWMKGGKEGIWRDAPGMGCGFVIGRFATVA